MSRNFTIKEGRLRRKFSCKAAKIEDDFNELIRKAYKAGYPPDISIGVMPEVRRPVIKIWFFKDSDSIQNE